MTAEPAPAVVEVRVPIDPGDTPLAYVESDGVVAVEVSGPGYHTTLVVSMGEARQWAAEVFAQVSVAYRETTGDPYALTDAELAGLADPVRYQPVAGIHVVGDNDRPARLRFHVLIDIDGISLSAGRLRAALVDHLTNGFNVSRIAVSAGQATAGTIID